MFPLSTANVQDLRSIERHDLVKMNVNVHQAQTQTENIRTKTQRHKKYKNNNDQKQPKLVKQKQPIWHGRCLSQWPRVSACLGRIDGSGGCTAAVLQQFCYFSTGEKSRFLKKLRRYSTEEVRITMEFWCFCFGCFSLLTCFFLGAF